MRANERKGAWALLLIIITVGIFLWIIGKCGSSNDSHQNMNEDVMIVDLNADSVKSDKSVDFSEKTSDSKSYESSRASRGSEVSGRSDGKSREARTRLRKKRSSGTSRKLKQARQPMRDLLSDTIYPQ